MLNGFDPKKHLTTERSETDGVTIFTLRGECDMHTAPYVRLEITPVLQGAGRVVVNLQNVSFMDSAGFGMLVGLGKIASDHKAAFCVAAPASGIVHTNIKILQVDRTISVFTTVEDALQHAAKA